MSEQHFRGALASGGTFSATDRGIEVYGPNGASLAYFGREVIAGVRRDGQVVTLERHADTIVTLTAASITDAVALEQFVRDSIIGIAETAIDDMPAAGDTPPLAFDAFDTEPEPVEPQPPPPPRPPIVARPDAPPDTDPHDAPTEPLPPPTPTIAPAPSTPEQVESEPEPIAPIPPPSAPPPPAYATVPQAETPLAGPPVYAEPGEEERGGRPRWLWGCLGCGGLLILLLVCAGVLLATGAIDPDDFDDDDSTPTPFIIIATSEEEPTPTEVDEAAIDATPTDDLGGTDQATVTSPAAGEATPTGDGSGDSPTVPPGEVLQEGETAVVGGVEVTYQGARIDTEGLFPPEPGRQYLVLDYEITNTTQEAVVVSSLLQFELLDEAGEFYSVELFADIETTLDAEVQPGDTLDGEIAFDIPEGSGPFTITYEDILSTETATWTVEQVEN